MLCSWVNQLFRLGHFPVRFLYVYQAEYIMGLKKVVRIMGIWHPPWKVTDSGDPKTAQVTLQKAPDQVSVGGMASA